MTLSTWAARHNIPPAALAELRALLIGPDTTPGSSAPDASEASIQNQLRMRASEVGGRLFRNNVGAGKLQNGSFVRWGLCNDSEAVNREIKSADLCGIYPVVITPAHVGSVIGQFWSVECKHAGWKYSGTDRERAQLKWIEAVTALGGRAQFSTGELNV